METIRDMQNLKVRQSLALRRILKYLNVILVKTVTKTNLKFDVYKNKSL